jgi:hypothetical protein
MTVMIRHWTLAAVALAVTMPLAAAQPQPPAAGPAENAERAGPPPGRGEGDRERGDREWRGHGPRWEHGRGGPHGMRGGRGMRGEAGLDAPSVAIRLGGGRSMRLQCGDTDIVTCLEAAQPLFDRMSEMPPAGPRGRGGPPAPGAGNPPPPPPPGEAPDDAPSNL